MQEPKPGYQTTIVLHAKSLLQETVGRLGSWKTSSSGSAERLSLSYRGDSQKLPETRTFPSTMPETAASLRGVSIVALPVAVSGRF